MRAESRADEERTKLEEEIGLARAACPVFDLKAYREGHMTPVYFGSALRTFGIEALLAGLARYAPSPRPQPAKPHAIDPADGKVAGFVFKVQANMDPNHRDRVAFLRLCSGRFKRGMKLTQVRSGKQIAINNPMFFVARERELAEEAFPGDIIGIPNHGTLRIGDTLTEGEALSVIGIPSFAPEILRRVRLDDPMRAKHLRRALEDLAEEGVSQLFKPMTGAQWIVGVVGELQLDVLAARIETEYGIKAGFEAAPYETARWVQADDPRPAQGFRRWQSRRLGRGSRRGAGLSGAQFLGTRLHPEAMARHPLRQDPRAAGELSGLTKRPQPPLIETPSRAGSQVVADLRLPNYQGLSDEFAKAVLRHAQSIARSSGLLSTIRAIMSLATPNLDLVFAARNNSRPITNQTTTCAAAS